jgi:hypothetical protein
MSTEDHGQENQTANTDQETIDTNQAAAGTSTDQVDPKDIRDPAQKKPAVKKPAVKKPAACSGF